ncbi:MAG: hypothetical protein ETSY1_06435 [Candidatus Entotheonella factor]|uniref:Uncharacterized protein n=1 Tax=Entotheonella factor TaxID=1429438 RepID=W4LUI8_ENTF1|nr:MAG: hypothetical protein ETSY1_06435 [Candidatus Entotheonella factor]
MNAKIMMIFLLLLALPSVGLALRDAPAPWLRDLCNTPGNPEPPPEPPPPEPPMQPSCTELFGDVRDFELCRETDETCRFQVRLSRSTCHQLCRSQGSVCVDADRSCNGNDNDTCMTQRSSEVCECERRDDLNNRRLSCEDAFGRAPGFQLCRQREDRCEFAATTGTPGNPGHCRDMCDRFRVRCLGARDNPQDAPCDVIPGSNDNCLTERSTEICICERPFR